MKLFFLLIYTIAFATTAIASETSLSETAKSATTSQHEQELVKYNLLSALLKIDRPLPQKKDCDFFTTNSKVRPRINEWISWNLSFFSSGQNNSITYQCHAKNKSSSICDVNFNADSSGESPWSCGFRFQIDNKLKKINLSTLECIGSC